MAGIFNNFDVTDIVSGRTTRVASGFWPNGATSASQADFVDDFPSSNQSFGTSPYDIRKTMYYLNVYPNSTYYSNNDPYFSIAYGNFYGNVGSGSFDQETGSIKAFPTKAIYTQYKNVILGVADVDGKFSFASGSSTVDADDIFVISFSTYKMKDKIDEGLFEISLSGSNGEFTFIDDSPSSATKNKVQSSYQLVTGSLNDPIQSTPIYSGIGAIYPSDGVVIFNASKLSEIVGWTSGSVIFAGLSYTSGSLPAAQNYTSNHKFFFEALNASTGVMKVRKSEFVPSRHYFIRVKNRDFNYSNNPTYIYDGSDGIHAKGTIINTDFINDPKTYVTTVGLYNDNNELVAVAKLSRPAVKSFDNELLIKVRLDF
jgi:hypothetical protein